MNGLLDVQGGTGKENKANKTDEECRIECRNRGPRRIHHKPAPGSG